MDKRYELPPEAEEVVKRRYQNYIAEKTRTGAGGTMTYKQYKEKLIREGVALFD